MNMNKTQLENIFRQAVSDYFAMASIVAETIHDNANLGLCEPGMPNQLMLKNRGVDVAQNGAPLFRLAVLHAAEKPRFPLVFGRAVQRALIANCYRNNYPYCVYLLDIKTHEIYTNVFESVLTLTWRYR